MAYLVRTAQKDFTVHANWCFEWRGVWRFFKWLQWTATIRDATDVWYIDAPV